MNEFLERARHTLEEGEYTCVLCKGERLYHSCERGVKPLVQWYESGCDLQGFCAADKVVGKGAAFLYLLLVVSAVYANVISTPALELLQNKGVRVVCNTQTTHIINRRGDGICPFELAVMDTDSVADAYLAIRQKMKEMQIG